MIRSTLSHAFGQQVNRKDTNMTDHRTISVYDSEAEAYIELVNKQPKDLQLTKFIARLNAGDYVLDLGCGPAFSSVIMREHGIHVVDSPAEIGKKVKEVMG